jgi:hypothetical protein
MIAGRISAENQGFQMSGIVRRPAFSITEPLSRGRREVLRGLAFAGGATALGVASLASAGSDSPAAKSAAGAKVSGATASKNAELAMHAHDWDWLEGNWDVWHRRLKERLAGSSEWDEFNGKSALWRTLDGLGTVDDNSLDLPTGVYRGLTVRAFDPETRQWSIWWLDGRNPSRMDPPVVGRFEADTGTFIGRDVHQGTPVTVRFRWLEIHSKRPNWEQAFSTDGGATWEVNWRNYFTRTSPKPTPLPRRQDVSFSEQHDWDFLVGKWAVRNRRLKERFKRSRNWEEFNSTLENWPVLGGLGNVGDNLFESSAGSYRGMSVRAFDPTTREWLSWWLDGRSPTVFASPTRGTFAKGVGTLIGDDVSNGRPVKVRSLWSHITPRSARWEQAASLDGGTTWETNWTSEFMRIA